MGCVDDDRHYFLVTGAPLAALAVATQCLGLWASRLLACGLAAQLTYALLAFEAPSAFPVDYGSTMFFTLFGVAVGAWVLASVATSAGLLMVSLTLLVPVLVANGNALADALEAALSVRPPEWVAAALFASLVVAAVAVLWRLGVFRAAKGVACGLVAALAVWLLARVAWLEADGAHTFCCPGERCPLALDDPLWLALLLLLAACFLLARLVWPHLGKNESELYEQVPSPATA